MAALRDQHPNFGVLVEILFVEPGELGEHLEIAIFLGSEDAAAFRALRLPGVVEFAIARVAVDHARGVRHEEVAQDEGVVAVGKVFGGLEGGFEERVFGLAARVFLHLHHHGRDEVEGLANVRKFFQDLYHAVVILERVHARPGQAVLARGEVLIKRLVHVP